MGRKPDCDNHDDSEVSDIFQTSEQDAENDSNCDKQLSDNEEMQTSSKNGSDADKAEDFKCENSMKDRRNREDVSYKEDSISDKKRKKKKKKEKGDSNEIQSDKNKKGRKEKIHSS